MGNCAGRMKCLDVDGDGDVDWDDFDIIVGKVGDTIGTLSTLATAAATAAVAVNPELGKTDAYQKFQEAMVIINNSNSLVREIGRRDSKFRTLYARLTDELDDLKDVKTPAEALTNFKEATEALNAFTTYLSEHPNLKKMFGKEFNKFQVVVADAKKYLDAFMDAHSEVRTAIAREQGGHHARGEAIPTLSMGRATSPMKPVVDDTHEREVALGEVDTGLERDRQRASSPSLTSS